MTAIEKHLFLVQQKVEHLNSEVATLIARTSSKQPHPDGTTVVAPSAQSTECKATSDLKPNIGINRYRQLTSEHPERVQRGLTNIH